MRRQAVRRSVLVFGTRLRHGLVIGAMISAAVLIACAFLFYAVEKGKGPEVRDLGSGFLWVTRVLVQGEPPWEPRTGLGQVLFYLVVLTGVGLIAIATGAVATKLIGLFMRREAGMGEIKFSDHIVICGWSPKGEEILRELHAEEVEDKRPVVILAPLDANPSPDDLTTFIRGVPSDGKDLLRAGIDGADTAIILADGSNPAHTADDIDAKSLLTTLAVESINPNCYTCVEVIRSENRQHFERTKADELVVSAELTGALLAISAVTHGMSGVVADLITHPGGNEFYSIPTPASLAGSTFREVMAELKDRYDCLLVACGAESRGFEVNPPPGRVLEAEDRLLVIAGIDPSARIAAGEQAGRTAL
jgi:voltage-gated potassium channel